MPIKTIIQYNNPIIRQYARLLTIAEIQQAETQMLVDHMVETMRAAPGVGLAAPQVAASLQLFVAEDRTQYHQNICAEVLQERQREPFDLEVFFNPKLTILDATQIYYYEACLSCGEFCWIKPRARQVKIAYLNHHAEPCELIASGWLARIMQHEYDHLQGIILHDTAAQQTRITMAEYREHWLNSTAEQVRVRYEQIVGLAVDE